MNGLKVTKCGICGQKRPESLVTTYISPMVIKINDKCTLTLRRGTCVCDWCKQKYIYENEGRKIV